MSLKLVMHTAVNDKVQFITLWQYLHFYGYSVLIGYWKTGTVNLVEYQMQAILAIAVQGTHFDFEQNIRQ